MNPDLSKICFGLTEEIDRESFASFLMLCGRPEFAKKFSAKLSSEEIIALVDSVMDLFRTHLSKEEYHSLFLQDPHHHDLHTNED